MSDTPITDHAARVAGNLDTDAQEVAAAWNLARQLERELAEARPVMDMLLLDGNVGPELKGAAKLRAIIDALIAARTAIEEHNRECDSLCDGRKSCGYEQYRTYMSCSACPKDWKIEP